MVSRDGVLNLTEVILIGIGSTTAVISTYVSTYIN